MVPLKIRALCVMKNEADIIEQTLSDALRWCDEIFVLDNGSDDGSWELVKTLAAADPRIVAHGRDMHLFHDGIRAQLYNAYKSEAVLGDWWCRLDSDEFYVDDPRTTLGLVPSQYFSVWSASISYYFTDLDLARYLIDPALFADDVPVSEKCRYYLNHWSEPRFFRHNPATRWRQVDGGFPLAVWGRPAAPFRIPVRHFAYRSPSQIQKRLDARRTDPGVRSEFSHEMVSDWSEGVARIREKGQFIGRPENSVPSSWRERVVPAEALDFDAHDGHLVINDDLMPKVPRPWSPVKRGMARVRTARKALMLERTGGSS